MSNRHERLRAAIAKDRRDIHTQRKAIGDLLAENERLRAVYEAAQKLKADMIMRADIGTFDGDHSVQAGATVWYVFCEALAAVEGDDEQD